MKHFRTILPLYILCAMCACAHTIPAFAWGQEGHRIIAQVAYANLSKRAQRSVSAILGQKGIIYWANWPDEIKSDTIYPDSYDWHFQDFNPGMSDSLVADALVHYPAEGGNLLRATDSLISVLREGKRQAMRQPDDAYRHTLRFVIHLIGDRFCPMHTARMDDKGGNTVRMAWFSRQENTSLHAVWDTRLIDSQGYSYTEYAEKLLLEYAPLKRDIEQMSEADILIRNYHLTQDIYAYQSDWDNNTYHYIYRWRQPMELQLYMAGIRLAQLLNDIY